MCRSLSTLCEDQGMTVALTFHDLKHTPADGMTVALTFHAFTKKNTDLLVSSSIFKHCFIVEARPWDPASTLHMVLPEDSVAAVAVDFHHAAWHK